MGPCRVIDAITSVLIAEIGSVLMIREPSDSQPFVLARGRGHTLVLFYYRHSTMSCILSVYVVCFCQTAEAEQLYRAPTVGLSLLAVPPVDEDKTATRMMRMPAPAFQTSFLAATRRHFCVFPVPPPCFICFRVLPRL